MKLQRYDQLDVSSDKYFADSDWCKSEDVKKLEQELDLLKSLDHSSSLENVYLKQLNDKMLEMLKRQDLSICETCKRLNPQHINCISCPDREIVLELMRTAEAMR